LSTSDDCDDDASVYLLTKTITLQQTPKSWTTGECVSEKKRARQRGRKYKEERVRARAQGFQIPERT